MVMPSAPGKLWQAMDELTTDMLHAIPLSGLWLLEASLLLNLNNHRIRELGLTVSHHCSFFPMLIMSQV